MVYKRYVRKNGKVYGPYYYKSVRRDGVVEKEYLGPEYNKRNSVVPHIVLASIVAISIFLVYLSFHGFTGNAIINLDDLRLNGSLSGNVIIGIAENESISENSTVSLVIYHDLEEVDSQELAFSELAGTGSQEGYYIGPNEYSVDISKFANSSFDSSGNYTILITVSDLNLTVSKEFFIEDSTNETIFANENETSENFSNESFTEPEFSLETQSTPGNINTCQVLDTPGVYNLTSNITYDGTCFTIVANGVILDGQGFNISLNNTPTGTNGIIINGTSGNAIRNIGVYNYARGINVTYGVNNNISNVAVVNSTNNILVVLSNLTFLANVLSTDSSGNGISLSGANNTLANISNFRTSIIGISITSTGGTFSNITIMNTTGGPAVGIDVTASSSGNSFTRLYNYNSTNTGISIAGSNNTVNDIISIRSGGISFSSGNNVSGSGILAINTSSGITLSTLTNSNFTNLTTINSVSGGISISAGRFIYLYNLTTYQSSGYGVTLNANHSILTNINSYNNSQGLILSFNGNGINNTIHNLNSHNNSLWQIADLGSTNTTFVYTNPFGQIRLYNSSNWSVGSGRNITFPGTVNISNNTATINSDLLPTFNRAANITLNGIATNISNPRILKDGVVCTDCYNFTSLNASSIVFNVTSWSTYMIASTPQLSACQVINSSGTYIVTQDISASDTCFNITANNVILDGQGHNLDYDFSVPTAYGIVMNSSNNIIRNFSISNYDGSVFVSRGSNNTITYVDALASSLLLDENSNNSKVYNSSFTSATYFGGVEIYGGSNNIFYNIDISDSNFGIAIYNSSIFPANNNTFTNILLNDNVYSGLYIETLYNSVFTNITANDNDYNGINFHGINGHNDYSDTPDYTNTSRILNLTFNNIVANNNGYYGFSIPVSLNSTYNNITVRNNLFEGIAVTNSYNSIFNNITAINNSGLGLHLGASGLSAVFYGGAILNVISTNNGFNTTDSAGTSVYSFNGQGGIYIDYNNNTVFSNINSSNNRNYGIRISGDNNLFSNITTTNNSVAGIIANLNNNLGACPGSCPVLNNSFYNNTIVNLNSYGNGFSQLNSTRQNISLIYSNQNGKILFTNLFNFTTGSNHNITFPGTVNITLNKVVIDSNNLPEFNKSANVTLYNLPRSFGAPRIFKDSQMCLNCYNFTSLNAGNVTFNVTSWSNYSINESTIVPLAPIIPNQYACEGSTFSTQFNVSNSDISSLGIILSPQNPFFVDPSAFSGNTSASISLFSGTLTKSQIGNYSEIVNITNGYSSNITRFNITVIETNEAPSISSISSQSASTGSAFSYQISVSDAESGNQYSGNLSFNITGTDFLSINNSGYINGTTVDGSYTVGVCITDRSLTYVSPNISLCGQTGTNVTSCTSFSLAVTSVSSSGSSGGGGGSSSSRGGGGGGGSSGNHSSSSSGILGSAGISLPNDFAGISCLPSFSCGEWGMCDGTIQARVCKDSVCGRDPIVQTRPCSNTCNFNFSCGEWSQCNYLDRTDDLLKGELTYTGYQTRACQDTSGCVSSYREENFCSESSKVNFVKINQCGQEFVAAVDNSSRNLIVRISLEALKTKRLDIRFLQGDNTFCSTCYNGIKDGNEEGLDCGGSCKKCQTGRGFPYIILVVLTAIAILILIYYMIKSPERKVSKISRLITEFKGSQLRNDKQSSMRIYENIMDVYNSLNDNYKALVKSEIKELK